MIALLASLACGGPKDSTPLTGGETCTPLKSGTWTFSGAAWRMGDLTMDGDVTMDADACTFTLDAWTMAMNDLPNGGAMDGDTVQLDGKNSYWRSCTGTASDPGHVSGTCSDDDAEFEMTLH